MNRRLLVIGTVAAAAIAFAGAASLYDGADRDPPAGSGAANLLVRDHSPFVGPSDAGVTIVEFLDPSCEACRAFYPVVKQIMAALPGQTRLVIRYAPLHEGSDEAVRILEAARLQDRFEPVLEALFRDQDQWAVHGAPDLERAWSLAGAAGLDVARGREDAKSSEIARVLELDIADMKAAKVEATPSFFVNGKPLTSFGAQQLYDLVAAEVQASGGGGPAS